ncbi:uncharacterized protein LOC133196690 [Saccostrea echinata]|uniref:uncharacterized protein LOC133196690 n=1 Tax=Saccostrea echinata TaxID=191078 RepID=UPI002A7F49C5|nr:uncharacterized protein LOC133196690 [Saccostrea echinata]
MKQFKIFCVFILVFLVLALAKRRGSRLKMRDIGFQDPEGFPTIPGPPCPPGHVETPGFGHSNRICFSPAHARGKVEVPQPPSFLPFSDYIPRPPGDRGFPPGEVEPPHAPGEKPYPHIHNPPIDPRLKNHPPTDPTGPPPIWR